MNITADGAVSMNQGNDDGFWIICGGDGRVLLCSRAASDFGMVNGVSDAAGIIMKHDRPDFKDAIRTGNMGGEVSVLFGAIPESGYSVAHLKSTRLFSSPAMEIHLYRNKNEYLAVSAGNNGRLSRVFSYMSSFSSEIENSLRSAVNIDGIPELLRNKIGRIMEQIERLSLDEGFIASHYNEMADGGSVLLDASALFNMISDRFAHEGGNPFAAVFENCTGNIPVMCRTDTKRFSGIVLMTAAVAARLSGQRRCKVALFTDGDSVVIEASCILHKDYRFHGRSCDFERLYRCLPADPVELMMLEHLTSVSDWEAEYSSEQDGNFAIRVTLLWDTNPDRLKFRDGLAGADDAIGSYLDYLGKVFSPDSQ